MTTVGNTPTETFLASWNHNPEVRCRLYCIREKMASIATPQTAISFYNQYIRESSHSRSVGVNHAGLWIRRRRFESAREYAEI